MNELSILLVGPRDGTALLALLARAADDDILDTTPASAASAPLDHPKMLAPDGGTTNSPSVGTSDRGIGSSSIARTTAGQGD